MSDYISREAALNLIDRYWQQAYNAHFLDAAVRLGSVYREMEDIPAADVRPVVLCRDCKHRFMTPNGWNCPYAEWGIEDDDFCSCGEKREES